MPINLAGLGSSIVDDVSTAVNIKKIKNLKSSNKASHWLEQNLQYLINQYRVLISDKRSLDKADNSFHGQLEKIKSKMRYYVRMSEIFKIEINQELSNYVDKLPK
jgi:hypothetical protein